MREATCTPTPSGFRKKKKKEKKESVTIIYTTEDDNLYKLRGSGNGDVCECVYSRGSFGQLQMDKETLSLQWTTVGVFFPDYIDRNYGYDEVWVINNLHVPTGHT